jgi:hypothetical protein
MEDPDCHDMIRRQFLKSAVLSSVGFATGRIRALSAPINAAKKPLTLVQQGKSTYSICVSETASPSEKHGAEELQKFLEEMSGARLPIVTDAEKPEGDLVLVGNSKLIQQLGLKIPFERLGSEGFVLRTAGNHVVIVGGRQRGTMYGVYTFLEKLGCRWFTRGLSVIPKKPTLTVEPLDEMQKPAFEYREASFWEAFDKDWAARNKMNGSSMNLDDSTGGKFEYYPFVHTFYLVLPPDKYFGDHPEYYALVDGKRRSESAQLCLTNPNVLRLTIKTVLEWIEQHPEASIYSVSQNDCEGWCECDNCRRVEQEEGGAHSGPILRFVNAVAAEVAKKHPEKLIDTLAYWYSEAPPLHARPLPNVRIRLCPIGACEAHAYENCKDDAYFLNHLRRWSTITNQLYIWHYVTNFSHYLLPFPDFDELAADIPMYRKNGVVGIFLEGDYADGGGGENAELRSYVMARLLWNPRIDVNKIIDEFMAAYYGKAARPMRAYFDLLHRQVRPAPRGKGHHMWIYTNPGAPYLSEDFLAESLKLFHEAEAAAADDATRMRVGKARLSIAYVRLMHAKAFQVRDGWYAPVHLDQLKESFQSFMNDVRSFGITELHEGSKLAEDREEFSKFVKPYRVATLENATLRIDVVPELSGRAIQMIDKRTGKDVLHRPDPGEPLYPDAGGLSLFVYSDYLAEKPYEAKWGLESQAEPSELLLSGTYANGLKARRALRLRKDEPVVHTETTLENAGTSVLDVVLQSQYEFDAKSTYRAVLSFRQQDGKRVDQRLIELGQEPTGSKVYEGSEQPDGEWVLSDAGTGPVLVNRFPKEQVSRCFADWTGKAENVVTLGLWSAKRALAPGEALKLEAEYGIRKPAMRN